MKNHTLMQTIARANRVFQNKTNGLIVDYAGVFKNLQKALAIYGSGSGGGIVEGDTPVSDKKTLVELLRKSLQMMTEFCEKLGICVSEIEKVYEFERIKLLDDAVEAILISLETQKEYLSRADYIDRIFKAVLPDPSANEFGSVRKLFVVIAEKIRSLAPKPDISHVMQRVEELLDRSIAAEGYVIGKAKDPGGAEISDQVDLSKIDFDALNKKFDKARKRIEVEKLKNAIYKKLATMVELNKARVDYMEKFQKMIDEYNAGSINVDIFFQDLLAFAKGLREEEKRSIAENLSEEELALFDILTRPEMKLKESEKKQVKKVARELLQKLKNEKLVLDWRKKQQSRALVLVCVEEMLESLPDIYTPDIFQRKCNFVYQHIYDSYPGLNQSIYPGRN